MFRTLRFPSFLVLAAVSVLAMGQASWAQQFAGGERLDPQATPNGSMRVITAFQESAEPKYFAISGAVVRPGVYSAKNGRLTLQQLVDAAGGLKPEASPSLRVLRNGHARLQIQYDPAKPGAAVPLFPGDVVVAISNQPSVSSSAEGPLFVPIVCLGLLERPVVLPLDPRIRSVADLVHELWQPKELANTVQVLDPSGRRESKWLASGMILVFDPNQVDHHGLSQTRPLPDAIPVTTEVQKTANEQTTQLPPEPTPREESNHPVPLFEDETSTTSAFEVPPSPESEADADNGLNLAVDEVAPLPPVDAITPRAGQTLAVAPQQRVRHPEIFDVMAPASPEVVPGQENWLSSSAPNREEEQEEVTRDSSSPGLKIVTDEEPVPVPGVQMIAVHPPDEAAERNIRTAQSLHADADSPRFFSRDEVQYAPTPIPQNSSQEILEAIRKFREAAAPAGFTVPASLAGSVASQGIEQAPSAVGQASQQPVPTPAGMRDEDSAAPPPPLETQTSSVDQILRERSARQRRSESTAGNPPVSVQGVLPVVLGVVLLMAACLGISVLWTKIEARENALKTPASSGTKTVNGDGRQFATVEDSGIQQLLSRTLPVIEEQILVPRERLLYGKVVGHRRIVLNSAHETIEGPHYARTSRPRNTAAATMSAALDEQTLRQSLRDAMRTSPRSDEMGLEPLSASAKPLEPRSKETDLADDLTPSADSTANPEQSPVSVEIPMPPISETPLPPAGSTRKSVPVSQTAGDEVFDIVQPEFHPGQKTPQSPLERALRTLSSEKRG